MDGFVGSTRLSKYSYSGVVQDKSHIVAGIAKHSEKDEKFAIYSPYQHPDPTLVLQIGFLLKPLERSQRDPVGEEIFIGNPHPDENLWEHFKSRPDHPRLYEFFGFGRAFETTDDFVLYRPTYSEGIERMILDGVDWLARPRDDFFGYISRNLDGEEYRGPRFWRTSHIQG